MESKFAKLRKHIDTYGEVPRNWALANFVSARLSARIGDLEEEGYVFRTEWRGGDYVYVVTAWPKGATMERPTVQGLLFPSRVSIND